MTVQHKVVVIRPSLDNLWFTESKSQYKPFGRSFQNKHVLNNDGITTGFVSQVYEEQITWAEVFARKDELRPDLRDLLATYDQEAYTTDTEEFGIGPMFNPFTLTITLVTTYDTMENTTVGLDVLYSLDQISLIDESLTEANNTITAEELLVDGIRDETFVGKFL